MKIIWNDELSVGVKEIDEQHKYFISILNDLFDVFYSLERQPQQIINIFEQAFNYAKYHFATEEKYFYEFKYEEAGEHITRHHQFKSKMEELRSQFEKDKIDPTTDLMEFFEDWLVNHLNTMDKKYTKCFHDHGLY